VCRLGAGSHLASFVATRHAVRLQGGGWVVILRIGDWLSVGKVGPHDIDGTLA
jgi:hypothetical protein